MNVAKDRHLVIARIEPQHVLVQVAHATAEEARAHAQQLRMRADVASVEESFAPCFQGRRVTRVWL